MKKIAYIIGGLAAAGVLVYLVKRSKQKTSQLKSEVLSTPIAQKLRVSENQQQTPQANEQNTGIFSVNDIVQDALADPYYVIASPSTKFWIKDELQLKAILSQLGKSITDVKKTNASELSKYKDASSYGKWNREPVLYKYQINKVSPSLNILELPFGNSKPVYTFGSRPDGTADNREPIFEMRADIYENMADNQYLPVNFTIDQNTILSNYDYYMEKVGKKFVKKYGQRKLVNVKTPAQGYVKKSDIYAKYKTQI